MGPGVAAKVDNLVSGRSRAKDEKGVWSALKRAWPARKRPQQRVRFEAYKRRESGVTEASAFPAEN